MLCLHWNRRIQLEDSAAHRFSAPNYLGRGTNTDYRTTQVSALEAAAQYLDDRSTLRPTVTSLLSQVHPMNHMDVPATQEAS